MAMTHSSICFIGDLTCMGCCGRDYTSRKDVEEGISKNTWEFKDMPEPKEFLNRPEAKFIRDCGICRNIVYSNEERTAVKCPCHPFFTKEKYGKEDIREGHCEVEYLCKAAFLFDLWDEDIREKFVKFIESKDFDWYTYSMAMDDDSLVDEFIRLNSL